MNDKLDQELLATYIQQLDRALQQRTRAYQIKAPKAFITAVNNQIWTLRVRIAEMGK